MLSAVEMIAPYCPQNQSFPSDLLEKGHQNKILIAKFCIFMNPSHIQVVSRGHRLGQGRHMKNVIFQPTCAILHGGLICIAFCLSVCLSVWTRPKIRLENNSYLGKYYGQQFETLPQYRGCFGAFWKNTNYTLKRFFSSQHGLFC